MSTYAFQSVSQQQAAQQSSPEIPGMFDLILRGQTALNALMRDERALPSLVQKLLGLSVLGLAIHGLVVGLTAQFVDRSHVPELFAQGNPVVWMPIASVLAFLGALCICLPSFYFYTQLSGLDASFRLVTAQALRGQATTSVLMLGVLPFYAAWALASVLGFYPDPSCISYWDAPVTMLSPQPQVVLMGGLALPFVIGLLGVRAIYRAFTDMAQYLPVTHRRRGNFLRRMVLAWGAVYTTVAPVALYRLSQVLSSQM